MPPCTDIQQTVSWLFIIMSIMYPETHNGYLLASLSIHNQYRTIYYYHKVSIIPYLWICNWKRTKRIPTHCLRFNISNASKYTLWKYLESPRISNSDVRPLSTYMALAQRTFNTTTATCDFSLWSRKTLAAWSTNGNATTAAHSCDGNPGWTETSRKDSQVFSGNLALERCYHWVMVDNVDVLCCYGMVCLVTVMG